MLSIVPLPLLWISGSLCFGLVRALAESRLRPQGQKYLRIVHWVLIPYIGLLLGHLSPTLMGLTHIDWLPSLKYGMGIIFVVIILFGLIHTIVIQPTTKLFQKAESTSTVPFSTQTSRQNDSLFVFTRLFNVLLVAGAQEFYWSFLRGACLETLLIIAPSTFLPAYSAIWLASVVVGLELLTYRQSAIGLTKIGVIMVTTSILFFYTQNYWLCWWLHMFGRFILSPSPYSNPLSISENQHQSSQ